MSDTPQKPGDGETALPEGTGPAQATPQWETVTGPGAQAPVAAPAWSGAAVPVAPAGAGAGPMAGGYTNLQSPAGAPPYVGAPGNQGNQGYAGYPPPAAPLPPPAYPQGAAPAGGGGYQPVYGGGPAAGAPPAGYGVQPGLPPGYGQPGMPQGNPQGNPQGYPPQYSQQYSQQFPQQQGNYGANVAEMLAVGALMTGVGVQRRRVRRHLIFWPLMIVLFVGFMLLRGCLGFLHLVGDAGKPEIHALHDRMKQDDLRGIYASADAAWQSAESRAQSDALFAAVHQQLGDPVNYDVRSVSMNSESGTKDLVLATVFSRAQATETIRFHKSGGTYLLASYRVTSPSFHFDGAGHEETF